MKITEGTIFYIQGNPDSPIRVEHVFDDGTFSIGYPGQPEQGTTTVHMSYWPELCEKLAILPSTTAA
jgi:hypothetical protein